MILSTSELLIELGLFGSGSSRARAGNSKNCRVSIGQDAGAELRFLVSDRAFVIAGIKQREHLV